MDLTSKPNFGINCIKKSRNQAHEISIIKLMTRINQDQRESYAWRMSYLSRSLNVDTM